MKHLFLFVWLALKSIYAFLPFARLSVNIQFRMVVVQIQVLQLFLFREE